MFEPEHAPRILSEEQEETVHETAMRSSRRSAPT